MAQNRLEWKPSFIFQKYCQIIQVWFKTQSDHEITHWYWGFTYKNVLIDARGISV